MLTRVIENTELAAAAAERQWLIKNQMRAHRHAAWVDDQHYATWCYCSWCPWSALSTPHYRRQDECPDPSEYRSA